MANLALRPKRSLSLFRRIAIGTWRQPRDCQVYGSLRVRMDEALRYIDAYREATGRRLTITHMMAKACGAVFQAMPDANAILRFHRPYLRDEIAIFFQVALRDPDTGELDLSGITVHSPEQKSLGDILDEFERHVDKVRKRQDRDLEGTRRSMRVIPLWLLGKVLTALSFLLYTLNLKLPGVARDAFGSAMVTNVGALGLEEAFPPLVPYSRCPLVVALGAVQDEPVVEGGELRVGKVMRICATMDHRLLDGAHAATMATVLRSWFEDPWTHFGPPESAAISRAGETFPG
ncbi:MAG: 2-oxo acid dehydrogenase subunit E2 [Myxococcales bacterium]|nr:2-oxo acid dehydrogenase subunit E2 [Myxococcales bacterium]